MDYAGGVGEAVRVAEETHVFGVAEAQRARIGALSPAHRTLLPHPDDRPPGAQHLPEPDLPGHRRRPRRPLLRRRRPGRLARRRRPAAGPGRDLRPADPERLPASPPGAAFRRAPAERRTDLPRERTRHARRPFSAVDSLARGRLLRLPAGAPSADGDRLRGPRRRSGRRHRPLRRRQVDPGADPPSAAEPDGGRYLINGHPAPSSAARTGTGRWPTCPSSRA